MCAVKMIIDLTISPSLLMTGVTAKASRLSPGENRVTVDAGVFQIIEGLPALVRTLALPGEHRSNAKTVLRAATIEARTALLRSTEGTFRVHKIYGDGNCMFRAVSYILWGNEDEHRALRTLVSFILPFARYRSSPVSVTRYISNHWWEYGPFVIAEWNITSPEEYSNFMMNEGVFATELECTVATKLHKMNLSIYREIDGGHGNYVKRVFHNRANSSYGTARLLFSGRSESGHYDVLFLER